MLTDSSMTSEGFFSIDDIGTCQPCSGYRRALDVSLKSDIAPPISCLLWYAVHLQGRAVDSPKADKICKMTYERHAQGMN